MRAACFQFDVRPGDVAHNLADVESGLREAVARECDLVVLPEMWPTSFPGQDEAGLLTPDRLEEWASATEAALEQLKEWTRTMPVIVCGSALGQTSGLPANRWHMVEEGKVRAAYDKVHLFTPTAEDASFSAGDEPPAWVETRHGRLGGIVCYDLRFPEVSRHLFHAGVVVIAVSAQWPTPRVAHWQALVTGRAVESQAFVVACDRTGTALVGRRKMELPFPGCSRIVGPDGRILAEGNRERGLVVAEFDVDEARKMRVRVPVEKDERVGVYAEWRRRKA